jgi:hypothetical protein
LALRIEFFDELVFDGWTDVGESPADALIVADDHEWNSGERDACDIEIAGGGSQVRLEPEVGHLVIEMHIIRQKRLSGDCVLAGDDPVVRSGTERIGFLESKCLY